MAPTRREFLAGGLGLTSSLGLGLFALEPGASANSQAAALEERQREQGHKIVVVVELEGGNDGFNTVVPAGQGAYYDLRPGLALGQKQVLDLGDKESFVGLHPAMPHLYEYFKKGHVALIPAVGIAGRGESGRAFSLSRSHVRAAQIWHSAQPDIIGDTGWLGRYLDLAGDKMAVCLSPQMPLALMGARGREKIKAAASAQSFSLATIGDMIVNDHKKESAKISGAQIYYGAMSGYDTHAGQAERHERLLGRLSLELAAFLDHLKKNLPPSSFENVLVLVHSEFGRSLAENNEGGSDHGGSGLCIVAGGAVKGGIYGSYGDLNKVRESRGLAPESSVDFRTVYATILDRWLGADSAEILGGNFGSLDFC